MMEKKYYVFRIDNENKTNIYQFAKCNHELRQGWGELLRENPAFNLNVEQGKKEFCISWEKIWGKNDANYKYMERKYNNLCKMKEFQEGDILIVPKVPDNYHFALYRVKFKEEKAYIFDTSWDNGGLKGSNNKMTNDYRHVVFVEYIGDVSYRSAEESSIVSAGFTSRRSAINSIYSQKIIDAIEKIIKNLEYNFEFYSSEKDISDIVNPYENSNQDVKKTRQEYYRKLINQIVKHGSRDLENLIKDLFEKNNFECIGKNKYDGQGGDVDCILQIKMPGLLSTLLDYTNNMVESFSMPVIWIQVKKKEGIDQNQEEGIEQLSSLRDSRYKDTDNKPLCVLINTTDSFNEKAKRLAQRKDILLIDGPGLVSLLLRYGYYD